jgi:predicted N-acyltransferase
MSPRWTPTVEPEEWDAFIEANQGTPYQSWFWRLMLEELGNRPEYLVYREPRGGILAACPLFRVRVGRYRQKLTAPSVYNRVSHGNERVEVKMLRWREPIPSLFRNDSDVSEAARALQLYLKPSVSNPLSSIELLTWQTRVIESLTGLGFRHWKTGGYFLTDLEKSPPDKIWAEVFGKHDRQDVKYFDALGTSFRLSTSEGDYAHFRDFHENTMLRKGYSPMTGEFLSVLRRHLGDKIQLALFDKSGELVAGQLLVLDRISRTVYVDKVAYQRSRNIHSSVVALWFRICEWAKDNEFRYINFGGARSEEAYRLKRKFGGEFTEKYVFVVPSASKLYSTAAGLVRTTRRLTKLVTGRQAVRKGDES